MPKAAKSKKGSPAVVHPHSRQAAQMVKQTHRDQRLDKHQKDKNIKTERLGVKLQWFHDELDDSKTSYSRQEACQLIEKYLGRFSEELEQIELVNSIKGRSGMQHASRLQCIKVTMEAERREYDTIGLEIPDILNTKQLRAFREWQGELRLVQNLKMKRIKPCTSAPDVSTGPEPPDSSSMDSQGVCMDEQEHSQVENKESGAVG